MSYSEIMQPVFKRKINEIYNKTSNYNADIWKNAPCCIRCDIVDITPCCRWCGCLTDTPYWSYYAEMSESPISSLFFNIMLKLNNHKSSYSGCSMFRCHRMFMFEFFCTEQCFDEAIEHYKNKDIEDDASIEQPKRGWWNPRRRHLENQNQKKRRLTDRVFNMWRDL
jgi:hypothetical protein